MRAPRTEKSPTNPDVDWFFDKADRWQKEVRLLRAIPLSCGLEEVLKWGCPCYAHEGRNVVLIHTFKDYCAFLFMKGALLEDPDGLLVQQTANVQAARQIRFTSVKDVKQRAAAVEDYVRRAIALEKAGVKVAMKTVKQFTVPAEFQARLDATPALKAAFDRLTPGRRKAYLLHFGGAKKAETREARIDKCLPAILQGRGLDD